MGAFKFEKTETEKMNERLDELEKLIREIKSRVDSEHPLPDPYDKRRYDPYTSRWRPVTIWPSKTPSKSWCPGQCGSTLCLCFDRYYFNK